MLLFASWYPASPCGPRRSVRHRVVLLPVRWEGGHRAERRVGERELLATEHHGTGHGPSTATGRLPASR